MQLCIDVNAAPAALQTNREQACFELLCAAIRAYDLYPGRETAAARVAAARAYLIASGIPPSSFGAPPRLKEWRR
jgi:hypothetical protein